MATRLKTITGLVYGAFLVLVFSWQTASAAGEEFNGPFPSWADIKKRFGARGDGVMDDTRAIQRALDSLSCLPTNFNMGKAGYVVVYLPAGTYCISSTLVLKGRIGVSIIGEDPGKTIIKWTGPENDTMFWANGSAYFKLSRITWNANGKKGMEGVGIHWKERWGNNGVSMSFASLNIEISDNIFNGGFLYGISGGCPKGTGANDSEIAIRRCIFRDCGASGIEINDYNALDYWVWDCKFLQCQTGIQCQYGGYHVFRSFFSGSRLADLHNTHGYYNSARGCYSVNSKAFSVDETMSSNPFKRIFQDNMVIRPGQLPIAYWHLGKITLWGNKFSPTTDKANQSVVKTGSWAPGTYEVLSLHNIYPYSSPIFFSAPVNKLYSFGDKQSVVAPADQAFLKSMDITPVAAKRKVFEIPAGADSRLIQSMIDQAAALKGQRPVVHFPMGVYTIDRTLIIPAGADMQLRGDGLVDATLLIGKAGAFLKGSPMILVKGPSYVTVQDLQLGRDGDNDASNGLVFEQVDQAGARAFIDQVYSHADTTVVLKDLDNLYVQKENSFFTDGNYVSGGNLVQKGRGTAGLYCYGGQFAKVKVEKNGRFLAKDCWWEGETRVPVNLEGTGTVCIDGAMIAPNHVDSNTTIRIGKFNGHVSLMNMYIQGALSPLGENPGLRLFVWNTHYYHKMNVLDFLKKGVSYQAAFLGMSVQCFRANDPTCNKITTVEDRLVNVADVNGFMDSETAFARDSRPELFKGLPPGVSNIYISRVSIVGHKGAGISFTAR